VDLLDSGIQVPDDRTQVHSLMHTSKAANTTHSHDKSSRVRIAAEAMPAKTHLDDDCLLPFTEWGALHTRAQLVVPPQTTALLLCCNKGGNWHRQHNISDVQLLIAIQAAACATNSKGLFVGQQLRYHLLAATAILHVSWHACIDACWLACV
jgi:hypothetical protein